MITIRPLAQTDKTETVGWGPVPGATGYRFTVDGQTKRPHTWDPLFQRDKNFPACNTRIPKGSTLLVEALGVTDSGTYPSTAPPPPMGGALRAMFPTLTGPLAPTTGTLTQRWTPGSDEILHDWEAAGWLPPDAHAIYVNGASRIEAQDGYAHDMTSPPDRPQVAQVAGGSADIRFRRIRSRNIGYSSLDHAYYVSNASRVLIESCLIDDTYEYPIHIYGSGPVSQVVVANCTIRGSIRGVALAIVQIATADDILFVNCAFDGRGPAGCDYAIRNKAGTNIRAVNCMYANIDKAFDSGENPGNPIQQVNVSRVADLMLDPGTGKPLPGSPLIGAADQDWHPALDVYRNLFSTPDIGAVAA